MPSQSSGSCPTRATSARSSRSPAVFNSAPWQDTQKRSSRSRLGASADGSLPCAKAPGVAINGQATTRRRTNRTKAQGADERAPRTIAAVEAGMDALVRAIFDSYCNRLALPGQGRTLTLLVRRLPGDGPKSSSRIGPRPPPDRGQFGRKNPGRPRPGRNGCWRATPRQVRRSPAPKSPCRSERHLR